MLIKEPYEKYILSIWKDMSNVAEEKYHGEDLIKCGW